MTSLFDLGIVVSPKDFPLVTLSQCVAVVCLRESRATHREKMRGLMNLIVALLSSYISLATCPWSTNFSSFENDMILLVTRSYNGYSYMLDIFCTFVYESKKEHITNIPFFDNDIFKRVYSFHATKYFWVSLTLLRIADGKFLYTYNAYI